MNELMASQNLRYSVPGYYRDFLDEKAIARAEGDH
jgi:hypothetical protein